VARRGWYLSRRAVLSPAAFALLLLCWESLVRFFDVQSYMLPAPSAIFAALLADVLSPAFYTHVTATMQAVLGGFMVAGILGIVTGALIAQFKLVEDIVYPYIIALQTMPKVAIAPLLIVWIGFGIESKMLVSALVAFFPVLVNTVVGLKAVEQEKLDLMTALSATRWQTFKLVTLPNALPVIFAGLEIALVFSMIGAIVGEFVGARAGLGQLIQFRNMRLEVPGIFSILVVLAILGIILNTLIKTVGRKLIFWQRLEQPTEF
jgi:NitT/TauT family transport system permease protein